MRGKRKSTGEQGWAHSLRGGASVTPLLSFTQLQHRLNPHPVPQRRKQRAKGGYKGSYSWAMCMPPCMYRLPMCLWRKDSPETMLKPTLRVKGTWHSLSDRLNQKAGEMAQLVRCSKLECEGLAENPRRAWLKIPGTQKQKCETLSTHQEDTGG